MFENSSKEINDKKDRKPERGSRIEGDLNPEEEGELFSIERWLSDVVRPEAYEGTAPGEGKPDKGAVEQKIVEALKQEIPNMCSVTFERFCNLQCAHCIYPEEKSAKAYSDKFNLNKIVENIVRQLPGENDPPHKSRPILLHEGRIILPWHIDVLKKARQMRPDLRIGLIDNGTYLEYMEKFKESPELKLDWIDISVDGTEESHNKQRDPIHRTSYREAISGLKQAREVVQPFEKGGRVNVPFTLTNINYKDVEATADFLFSANPDAPPDPKSGERLSYADGLDITTMSPARTELQPLEISSNYLNGDVEEMRVAWEQIRKVALKYNSPEKQRVYLRIYRHQDLEKLAYAVGPEKFWHAITHEEDERKKSDGIRSVDIGRLTLVVDGIPVTFSPLSIWPQETFLVDADASNRLAYSLKHTIYELRKAKGMDEKLPAPKNAAEEKVAQYTVKQLTEKSDFIGTYREGVDQWWQDFGKKFLAEEAGVLSRIRAKAQPKK